MGDAVKSTRPISNFFNGSTVDLNMILFLDLLSDTEYNQSFNELGEQADEKYEKLPPGFTKQYLSWLPTGYTLKVYFCYLLLLLCWLVF